MHARLENGLEVYLLPRPQLPLVTVGYVNREAADGRVNRAPGLAVVTGDALRMGGTQLADGTIITDITIGGQAPRILTGFDATTVTWRLPARALGVAVRMLSRLVRHPAFEAPGVERAKLASLHFEIDRGHTYSGIGQAATMAALFGRDHPWAADEKLVARSVIAIERADLTAYHENVYRPSHKCIEEPVRSC